jgi:hypothetical protein
MGFRLPTVPTGEGITDERTVLQLAHVRQLGAGDPGWPGTARTIMPNPDPSVSLYDSVDPYGQIPDQLTYRVSGGVVTERKLLPPGEYTETRQGKVSAFQSSVPAAHFFQGVANFRWSGIMQGFGLNTRALVGPRPLSQNMNLAAFGTKELHRATQYEPVPPMGSLVGYYGSGEKAL